MSSEDDQDVLEWRIYCNEEAAFVSEILRYRIEGAPTLCPNDHANRTNFTNAVVIDSQLKNNVTVNEPTQGLFEAKMYKFDIPAGATGLVTVNEVRFPTNVLLWRTNIEVLPTALGDQLTVDVAPNTVIGQLTAPVSSGNVINVPQATVQSTNVNVGCVVRLYDTVGAVAADLGQLVVKDQDAYTLTTELAVANSFPAGTLVQMCNYVMRDFEFGLKNFRAFGDKGIRAKRLPVGTPIEISWKNSTADAKCLFFDVEYYKY